MYRKVVCIGGSVILVLIVFVGALWVAPALGDQSNVAAKKSCDRACLDGFVDSYLDALAVNDPSRLSLTQMVKFTEDGQRLKLGDGLWNTATGRGTYKFYMDDVQAGQVGFFGTMREAGEPVIISLRLKIENHKIAEIETIVVRNKGEAENLEKRAHPDPLFAETIPAADRVSRAELVKTANMYFSGMQLNDGKGDYPFTDDCDRVENGMEATNNRAADTADAVAAQGNSVDNARRRADLSYSPEWGCKEQFQSGLLHFVTRIRDRRFVVIDPDAEWRSRSVSSIMQRGRRARSRFLTVAP